MQISTITHYWLKVKAWKRSRTRTFQVFHFHWKHRIQQATPNPLTPGKIHSKKEPAKTLTEVAWRESMQHWESWEMAKCSVEGYTSNIHSISNPVGDTVTLPTGNSVSHLKLVFPVQHNSSCSCYLMHLMETYCGLVICKNKASLGMCTLRVWKGHVSVWCLWKVLMERRRQKGRNQRQGFLAFIFRIPSTCQSIHF